MRRRGLTWPARRPTWPEVGELSRDVLESLRLAAGERDPAVAAALLRLAEITQRRVDDGLRRLIAAAERDSFEQVRREQLLQLFQRTEPKGALAFTRYSLEKARGQLGEGSLVF